jgi:hypothetical protein
MTATSGELWTRLLGQDSWEGQPGHNSQHRTAEIGKPEKRAGIVHIIQETEGKTARRGQLGRDKWMGHGRKVGIGYRGHGHSDRAAKKVI